ncbi:RICIN domain-containing protein [Kitasatospora sp. NPDC001660]
MPPALPPLRGTLSSGLAALAVLAATAAPARATGEEPVDGGTYVISASSDRSCLGPRFARSAVGTPAVTAACQGLLSQRWQLRRSADGHLLVNAASGACLAADLTAADCTGAARFTVSPAPGGYTLATDGRCLTARHDGPVRAQPCTPRPAQRWTLTRTEPLVLTDPGFEQGTDGWTFTEHTGVATNNPHTGTRLAYLDAGTGYRVSQEVSAVTDGTYDLSAWIAGGAAGGTFSVAVNGAVVRSLTLPDQPVYAKYTLPRVHVVPGDRLTLAIGSSPTGWVNVDEASVAPSAPNDPLISSSDPEVVALFDWAKTKANSWVQQAGAPGVLNLDENDPGGTGTASYDTTYWAGYPFRSDFYSRDFAHQLAGAHLLGLDAQNKTMLRAFAASATDANGLYPVWSVNFDAKTPGSIDYRSPSSFVRELPAPFELVEKTGEAYRWTGDRDYTDDPALTRYVRNTLGPFIARHPGPIDNGGLPIPQATSRNIFKGTASYAENATTTYAEAGDALAAQYQAYLAAATLADARGDHPAATTYRRAAETLREYANSTWTVDPQHPDAVVHGYDTTGRPLTDWGYEASILMPAKRLLDPGPRRDAHLAAIDAQDSGPQRSDNLEAYTYLPDAFFAAQDGDTAWKWMRTIYEAVPQVHTSGRMLNGDYPEIPFTLLSQTVQGLLGLTPNASTGSVVTTPHLPASMGWLQVTDIPIGDTHITLRQDAHHSTTLTNTGRTPLTWEARLPGAHPALTIDGTAHPARTTTADGTTYTTITLHVVPGRSTTVAVSD